MSVDLEGLDGEEGRAEKQGQQRDGAAEGHAPT
jgi:hypothetical protein